MPWETNRIQSRLNPLNSPKRGVLNKKAPAKRAQVLTSCPYEDDKLPQ